MPEIGLEASSTRLQDGGAYSLHVTGGGALSVVPGKYLKEEVHIRPWEHARNHPWHAEANKNGNIACVASDLNDWERFKFESGDSGTFFSVIFRGYQQYLHQPAQWDSLQVTEHTSSAIQLEVQGE